MKQKLELIPPRLAPTKELYKPSYSDLMAEIDADKKRVQIEKEKKRRQREEARKKLSFGSKLISCFWYFCITTGFYFLLVDPKILLLMIVFVIFMVYTRNLVSKIFNGPAVGVN